MAIWQWFQSAYDKIKGLEWSRDMKKTIERINNLLPRVISNAIFSYIQTQYASSEEKARESLDRLKKAIEKALG